MTLPPEFLRVDRDVDAQIKAVTADDARLWVREFADDDLGDVEFWAATLRADCTERRGYRFVADGTATDGAGRAGRWLEFRHVHEGEPYGYLVAMFVRPGGVFAGSQTVRTVEFAAREAAFVARRLAVVDALATLR